MSNPKEKLHDCPKCGRKKFTTAGLRAHKCKGAIVPAGRRPLTLAALDTLPPIAAHAVALKDLTVPQLGEAFRGLDAAQQNYSKLSGICATMKGLVLAEAKGKLGHGKFIPWLKENFPNGRQHASRLMRLAEAFGKCSPNATFDALTHDLLHTLEEARLSQIDLANPLVARVAAWVGNRSAYQLELELKMDGDGRRNNPGGFRPSMVELRGWLRAEYPKREEELIELVVNGSFTSLPKDVQAHFKKEGERYLNKRFTDAMRAEMQHEEDGRAWSEQIADALNLGVDKQYFHFATDEQWQAMQAAHTDLGLAFNAWAKERGAAKLVNALKH